MQNGQSRDICKDTERRQKKKHNTENEIDYQHGPPPKIWG